MVHQLLEDEAGSSAVVSYSRALGSRLQLMARTTEPWRLKGSNGNWPAAAANTILLSSTLSFLPP
jgi:hypothetical protein